MQCLSYRKALPNQVRKVTGEKRGGMRGDKRGGKLEEKIELRNCYYIF